MGLLSTSIVKKMQLALFVRELKYIRINPAYRISICDLLKYVPNGFKCD
jgi:hypothetical protein